MHESAPHAPACSASASGRPTVLLATMSLLPDGEFGGDLVAALDRAGVDARWAIWSDDDIDWSADLVAVRSTWDYHRRCAEFLAWARGVEQVSPLLNSARAFAWNADKAYLLDLADQVPIVPTKLMDESTLVAGLSAEVAEFGAIVIKPRIGASGIGVVAVEGKIDTLQGLVAGPWVVQPLVGSVRTHGETSVYVFAGRAASQLEKRPASGEIRIHELYGGRSREVPLDHSAGALAQEAVHAAGRVLHTDIAYARVDLMRWQDAWVVSELELIEPGLSLNEIPANADRFAELVRSELDLGGR